MKTFSLCCKPYCEMPVKVPVGCRFIPSVDKIHRVIEGRGFHSSMSEVRKSQWDILEAAHPPPMNQEFLLHSNLMACPNWLPGVAAEVCFL